MNSTDQASSSDHSSTPPRSPQTQNSHFKVESRRALPPQLALLRGKASPDDGKDLLPGKAQRPSCADRREVSQRQLHSSLSIAESFAPRSWLDDASISAVFARLLKPSVRPSPHPILLLEPSVTFWLALSDRDADGVQEAVRGFELESRQIVLCPVNDSRHGLQEDGGTHWSLLVGVARPTGPRAEGFDFMHYDSAQTSRRSLRQAQRVVAQLGGEPAEVRAGPCAQQENDFDCGVYVLMFSEIIVKMALLHGVGAGKSAYSCRQAWEKQIFALFPRQATLYRMQQRHALLEPRALDGQAMQTFSI